MVNRNDDGSISVGSPGSAARTLTAGQKARAAFCAGYLKGFLARADDQVTVADCEVIDQAHILLAELGGVVLGDVPDHEFRSHGADGCAECGDHH